MFSDLWRIGGGGVQQDRTELYAEQEWGGTIYPTVASRAITLPGGDLLIAYPTPPNWNGTAAPRIERRSAGGALRWRRDLASTDRLRRLVSDGGGGVYLLVRQGIGRSGRVERWSVAGSTQWIKHYSDGPTMVAVSMDAVYVGSLEGNLRQYDHDGDLQWTRNIGTGIMSGTFHDRPSM